VPVRRSRTTARVRTIQQTSGLRGKNALLQGRQPCKTRVCAYCRVSTDHENQETSFEAQQRHFNSLIRENPAWELVEIYADEESGTQADRRENFMRMIEDCKAGKIDMVLTKSISRFARNTIDCLNYIRMLKAMEIPIFFTKENINTMDAGGEVLITIMASIAQQESASISQNVQIGVRYHYQEGRVCSGVYNLLGYERTPDGSLEIVPEEAVIVRRIYRDYLDGYSPRHIAENLKRDGVDGSKVTAKGIKVQRNWSALGIEYILQNEKYTGDLLLQKYYTVDYLTRRTALNTGQLPQYYVENSHDPIVPKEVFLQVQDELARRKQNWREFRQSHANAFAGRLVCGGCGSPFRRRKRKTVATWVCESKTHKERHPGVECNVPSIREDVLCQVMVDAFAQLPELQEELELMLDGLVSGELAEMDDVLAAIDEELEALEEDEPESWDDPWGAEKFEAHVEELREQRSEAAMHRAAGASKALQIRSLLELIDVMQGRGAHRSGKRKQGACFTPDEFFAMSTKAFCPGEYCEDDVFRYVERIVRFEAEVEVQFKAGVCVRVSA